MNSRKTRDDEIYERGVHDGQRADALDQFSHNLVKGYALNPRENEIYNKGFEYGVAHRPQPSPATLDEPSAGGGASSGSGTVSSGSASGGSSILDVGDGNPICAIFACIGALWGLVAGFQAGGFWGAFGGAVFGMFGGYLMGIAVTLAIGVALLIGVFYVIFWVLSLLFGSGISEKAAAVSARTRNEARLAEAARAAEGTRIKQSFPGKWHYLNRDDGRLAELRISRQDDRFSGEYRSGGRIEPLSGQLQTDNRLRLVNTRQYGKLVRPGTWYVGDFSQEVWLQLGNDSTVLFVSFSPSGPTFVMNRSTNGAGSVRKR